MSRVYSTSFIGGNTSGVPLEYTVPAGYLAVVRHCAIYHTVGAVTNQITVGVLTKGPFCTAYGSATQELSVNTDLRVMVAAGQTVYAVSNYALGYAFVGGYLLSLP